MKARPILMSAPMVIATLRDLDPKSQTRRTLRDDLQWHGCLTGDCPHERQADCDAAMLALCPYGVPGDLLWVRESGKLLREAYGHDPEPAPGTDLWRDAGWKHAADGYLVPCREYDTPLSEWEDDCSKTQRPSIHMPRWASRLTLRITDIRVQRLQEISEEDARAEGVFAGAVYPPASLTDSQVLRWTAPEVTATAREAYFSLWDSLNGAGNASLNEWVWAISFDVLKANVDQVLNPIRVTACREADREMLATPAGQALIQSAAKALREGAVS